MAKMFVSTTEYEWAHGRKPRGEGHWAFIVKNSDRQPVLYLTVPSGHPSYSASKRWATKFVQTHIQPNHADELYLEVAP